MKSRRTAQQQTQTQTRRQSKKDILKWTMALALTGLLVLSSSLPKQGSKILATEELTGSTVTPTESTAPSTQPQPTPTDVPTPTPTEATTPAPTSAPTSAPTESTPVQPTPQPQPTPDNRRINILLGNSQITKGKFGESIDLLLPLVNWGNVNANDVIVSLIISDDVRLFPFDIEKSSYVEKMVGSLKATINPEDRESNTKKIEFKGLKIRDDVQTGYYPIRFQVSYTGNEQSTPIELYTYIKTQGDPNRVPGANEPHIPNTPPVFDGGSSFVPSSGGTENPSVPRMIVAGFRTDPAEVKAGQPFKLILQVRNTSAKTAVNNIKFTFNAAEDSMLPVSGSSTVYLPKIDKEGISDVLIELSPQAKLAQKPYPLSIKMEFEDDKPAQYTADETISIPIKQPARCEFSKPKVMPAQLNVGQEGNLMFSVYNKGKSPLYNVTITVPKGGAISGQNFFVGNIEAGSSKEVDMMIKGASTNTGKEQIKLGIEFEDDEGKKTTLNNEVDIPVIENKEEGKMPGDMSGTMPGDMGMPEQGQTPATGALPPYVIPGAIALGVILLVSTIALVRRHKKRKERLADEAEDNEMV